MSEMLCHGGGGGGDEGNRPRIFRDSLGVAPCHGSLPDRAADHEGLAVVQRGGQMGPKAFLEVPLDEAHINTAKPCQR